MGALSPIPPMAALTSLTGMSEGSIRQAWEDVRANLRRLDGCARHRFPGGMPQPGARHTCLECGGTMKLGEVGTYIRGYISAGGNPDDVWPGWTR